MNLQHFGPGQGSNCVNFLCEDQVQSQPHSVASDLIMLSAIEHHADPLKGEMMDRSRCLRGANQPGSPVEGWGWFGGFEIRRDPQDQSVEAGDRDCEPRDSGSRARRHHASYGDANPRPWTAEMMLRAPATWGSPCRAVPWPDPGLRLHQLADSRPSRRRCGRMATATASR